VEVPLSKGDLGGSNWHTLADDGYIYNQLLWHLEKAGQIAQIHLLLREGTAEGHNGWYSQCEREGKTAVFIKDVSRAWQLAEEHFIENKSDSIGLQVRYALITTSLNSLATNIPPELIAALIKHEIWTPAQGLVYVRQSQDSSKQAEGLEKITPYLPPTLLPEALEVARGIGDEYSSRAEALIGLAPHLPESLLPEALEIARGIGYEEYRAEALTGLAPHLPESLLPEALEIARGIGDEDSRARALTGLAPHLPEVLPEALEVARGIGSKYNRARALIGLAPYLPEVLPEALEVARGIGYEEYRAEALTGLAPHLPESLLPEALEVARGIGYEEYRAKALKALTATLTPANVDLSFWQDVLQALGTLTRRKFLETIPNLVPLILHFGGVVALREVYQGIREVSRWWR
jgi:hypothetical protein